MGKYKWVFNVGRNAAVGALAGGVAGRVVSDALGADHAQHRGAQVGATVGAVTGLPFGRIAKHTLTFSKVVARGLKATPTSKIGGAIRGAEKAGKHAGVVFRRIRGRIVPVKVK
jgi:hypothetical protein